ncbi:hypothetical protein CsatB_024424 [Cannabis sativa]
MNRVVVLVSLIIASILTLSSSNVTTNNKHSHFVLVHGAGHGAWCWYKVATLLQSTGHKVTAIDLTASGINPIQVTQVNGSLLDYAKPLTDFMASLPSAAAAEKVVLVGHSLGGLSISLAMERFPHKISAAVFVTALMPSPNLTYSQIFEEEASEMGDEGKNSIGGRLGMEGEKKGVESQLREGEWRDREESKDLGHGALIAGVMHEGEAEASWETPKRAHLLKNKQVNLRRIGSLMDSTFIYGEGPNSPPTALFLGPNLLASKFYQLSPPEDLVLGLSLVRPYDTFSNKELLNKQLKLTKEKYGSVRRVFIVCDQDHTIEESLQRWKIERNPPHQVMIINGTDHMVMFSKPLKLFSHLQQIAHRYY